MKLLVTFALSALLSTACVAQTFKDEEALQKFIMKQVHISEHSKPLDFEKKIDPKKCVADLLILKYSLDEAQTTLYRYASKLQIDSAFHAVMEKAKNGLTYIEMVREIAKIENLIACGHTSWSHSPEYLKYRNDHVLIFPFEIRLEKNHWTIFQNNSRNSEIPEGSQIISINGQAIEDILKALKNYTTRDGKSTDGSLREPAKYFPNAYSNFVDQPPSFKIEIQDNISGKLITYTVDALLKSEIDSIRNVKYPDWNNHGLPLKFQVIDSLNTAIYGIEWFRKEYIQNKGQDFIGFTDSVFSVIHKDSINNLVIDLRGNTGGWTAYGKYLFSYFIDEPTPYLSKVLTKKYRDYSFDTLIVQNDGFEDTFDIQQRPDGLYEWSDYPNAVAIPPDSNIYHGQTFILTDNFTRSCSGIFAALMREHTNAIFIGEETGAAQCGAGGMVISIILPHTRIEVGFSTGLYSTEVRDPMNNQGIIPDIPYSNFVTGDYDLEFIKNYLYKKQTE